MLAAERKQLIIRELSKNGKVLAGQLSKHFKVSEDTIRRDLRELAAEGILHRVHGGALPRMASVPTYSHRKEQSVHIKSSIGAAAARLLNNTDVVIIDGGTTP